MSADSTDERTAAAGITGVARTTGAAVSPVLAGLLLSHTALLSAPFFLAGGLKIAYDLLLYHSFAVLRATSPLIEPRSTPRACPERNRTGHRDNGSKDANRRGHGSGDSRWGVLRTPSCLSH